MDTQGAAPAPREIDASGLPMDRAQALVLDELRALTERAEPFAAILLMPAPPETRTPAASASASASESAASASGTSTADRVRTLKLIRPGLTALCRGLAFVAPADIPAERADAIHSGEQLWGCPTMATQDVTAARAWACARVGA
ncbi:hypothetical protein G3I47_06045 [Streptomyces anulatus]|uniref:hypothetical protein n=1 Tax=Streptomyces TaxID=1883 RepID=UPI000B40761C|nr:MULTISPECIES: hypothetical protein [Streptomyces]NDZ56835.1 hypothetical protein [Streptomyces anulatus]OWA21996.1 hypothetical protein B9W61_21685 [Streptomyces sp. CS057]